MVTRCPLRPQTARRGLTHQTLFRWQSPSSLLLQTTLNRKVNSFSQQYKRRHVLVDKIRARAGHATVCGIAKCIRKQFTNFGRRSVLRATNYRHGVWEIVTPTTNHPLTAIQYRTSNLSVARGTTLNFFVAWYSTSTLRNAEQRVLKIAGHHVISATSKWLIVPYPIHCLDRSR